MLKCIRLIFLDVWIAKYYSDALKCFITACRISGAKVQYFFEGLCVPSIKKSLLGEATPCCLLRAREGEGERDGREESSHPIFLTRREELSKVITEVSKEDSMNLTHFITVY